MKLILDTGTDVITPTDLEKRNGSLSIIFYRHPSGTHRDRLWRQLLRAENGVFYTLIIGATNSLTKYLPHPIVESKDIREVTEALLGAGCEVHVFYRSGSAIEFLKENL